MTSRLRWTLAIVLVLMLAGGWWLARPGTTESEIEAAQKALTAWGLFAGNGDTSRLHETFDDGPQLAQLRSEVIEPGSPYAFTLSAAKVTAPGFVAGTVTVSRPGELVQTFHWEIEMRSTDSGWKLWTVRTVR
ncbi:MAG: hypothetical protein ACRDVK_08320 [Acidimicrobiia bacterium]